MNTNGLGQMQRGVYVVLEAHLLPPPAVTTIYVSSVDIVRIGRNHTVLIKHLSICIAQKHGDVLMRIGITLLWVEMTFYICFQ